MNYNIKLYPKAEKQLSKLIAKDRIRILKSLIGLRNKPYLGKKLKGDFAGFYSIKVWPYRIIYIIKNKKCLIVVIKIGQREGIYK